MVHLTKRGFGLSLTEVVILSGLVGMLIILAMTYFKWARANALKTACVRNLSRLGMAHRVYAGDYNDLFAQLPGTGPWAKNLGFTYDGTPDFKGLHARSPRNVTASLYLLVRQADADPGDFVCPASRMTVFDGAGPGQKGLTELWDFGSDPYAHVSYVYHHPYGAFPADGLQMATFAVMADLSPWFKDGNIVPSVQGSDWKTNIKTLTPYWHIQTVRWKEIRQSNTFSHERVCQCILYDDGHAEAAKMTDAAIKHDNIYTFWTNPDNPAPADIRIGQAPQIRDINTDAKHREDSFLVQ